MASHRTGFMEKSTYQQIQDMHRRRKPTKKVRWLLIAAVIVGFLGGCNNKGANCDSPGSSKTDSKSHVTLHCRYNPTTGGNTWQ